MALRMKLFVLVFLHFFFIKSYSQSDFRNAYVITNENDTIKGFIDYKGNNSNARKCLFRKKEDGEILEFSPEQIKSYRFLNGKYYVSKSIQNKDKIESKFLEYLIDGIVDIYY